MNASIGSRGRKTLGWADLLPLAAVLAPVAAILVRSLKLGSACADLQGPLDARFVGYVLEWGYRYLHGAVAPDASFWSPPFFFPVPQTLAYSENLIAGYSVYFPLRWLGLGPSQALFFFHLVHRALTPIVAYFCLRALRVNRWPAFVGAAIFSWGWIRFFHYGHIQFSAGYPIPLFFTALYFAFHRHRPWALVLAAWTFLFTWYFSLYTAVFLVVGALAIAAVWLLLPGALREVGAGIRFYRRYVRMNPRQSAAVFLLCLTAAALIIPSAVIYAEVQKGFSPESEAQLRVYWGDVLSWVRPPRPHPFLASFDSLFPEVKVGRWEKNAFIGWLGLVGLLLPGIGLLVWGRKLYSLWPRSLVAVSGGGMAIMLVFSSYGGRWPEMPFLMMHRHLPGLSGMRAPTRIAFIVAWLVVLCLAAHLQHLTKSGRWLAGLGLGFALLAENLAPLPRIADRCADESIWEKTAEHLCPRVPRDEVGTLLFLPTELHSIRRVVQQTLAMRLAQSCDLNVVNGYSGRQPTLIAPLLGSPAQALPCEAVREIVDRVHQASGKAMLIHLDHEAPLGPAAYPASTIRDCLRSCLAPEPRWYVEQPGRPATVVVTDAHAACRPR